MAVAQLKQSNRPITIELYTPHAGQKRLHRSQARFRVVACGRRWGKTLACCNEIVKFACERPNTLCAWIAPTYRQSKIAYRLIKAALKDIIAHTSDSELRIELPQGSVMMFCSSDNYDALRGNGLHLIIIDECADVAEQAWTEVLRPCLSDTRGKAIFIGTPKGRNFFYRLFLRGQDPMYPDWESFTAPTSSNPYIPPEELVAVKRELPANSYLQEYCAAFLEESAGVFRNIDACVQGELCGPESQYDYVLGWDPAKHQDFSVMTVLNAHTMHVDAWERMNIVDYTVQLDRVHSMATLYNNAPVIMDVSGVGDPLQEQLKMRGLTVEGYLFTNLSKKLLIEELVVSIEQVGVTFPDLPMLIGELRTMEYTLTPSRNIQYSAPPGLHDDTVISLGLVNHAAGRSSGGMLLFNDTDVTEASPFW